MVNNTTVRVQIEYSKLAAELAKIPTVKGDAGEQGPAGPPGPTGPAGKDAEITEDLINQISNSVINNLEASGKLNNDISQASLQQIVNAVTDRLKNDPNLIGEAKILEIANIVATQIPGRRVVIVDGKTNTVIDDETYAHGEPIVVDFQKILNAVDKR